jgi:hypothetical protein
MKKVMATGEAIFNKDATEVKDIRMASPTTPQLLADKIEADGLCCLCDYGENHTGHGERKITPFPPDPDRELIVKALRAFALSETVAPPAQPQEGVHYYDAGGGFRVATLPSITTPNRSTDKQRLTPRTDAVAFLLRDQGGKVVDAEFARQLERELSAQSATAPTGLITVPERPSRAMIAAAVSHTSREEDEDEYRARGQAIAVYLSMLAAWREESAYPEGGA